MMGQDGINFDKLDGRSNFSTWEKKMAAFLRTRDLYKCVLPAPQTETDEDKLSRAAGWIFLACEDHITHHFGKDDSPLQIWEALRKTFAETGQGLHLQAVMTLSHTYRADCVSNDEYVGRMMEAWRRCTEVGIKFEDNIVALFMIGNLGPQYEAFRQSLIGSGQTITVDRVKAGLLELTPLQSQVPDTAYYSGPRPHKEQSQKYKSHIKCHKCGKMGHYKNKCRSVSDRSGGSSGISGSVSGADANKTAEAKYASALSASFAEMSGGWYLDSGASCHMTSRRDILSDFRASEKQTITVADDRKLKVEGCGSAVVTIGGKQLLLRNVLFVPQLKANLISLDVASRMGHRIIIENGVLKVIKNSCGSVLIETPSSGGVFKIEAKHVKCLLVKDDGVIEWHRKMGHMSYQGLNNLKKVCSDVQFEGTQEDIRGCISCAEGKQTRAPFRKKDAIIKTTRILDLVHTDVCGPMSTSLGGSRYFVVFIDDFSRKVFVYFLKEKSAVVETFRRFKAEVENQTGVHIKRLRSDNGTEFVNKEMLEICQASGIIHEKAPPYTPELNGVSERMNRTLIERARCMISDGNLDRALWAEAVQHAAFIVNRSVNRSLGNRCPEEIWTGEKPDLASLKIFGNPAMVLLPKVMRRKWDPKAVEMQFVGYSDKVFRFYWPKTKRVYTSRDATFLPQTPMKTGSLFKVDEDDDVESGTTSVGACSRRKTGTKTDSVIKTETVNQLDSSCDEEYEDAEGADNHDCGENRIEDQPILRRSQRTARPIVREDFVSYFARDCSPEDPKDREDALKTHDARFWERAMQEELSSFESNQSWTLVDLPPGRKAIRTKWVFKRKRAEDGSVLRHKARLVAKGCSQKYGVDYAETFSPVVRYGSLRLLIAMAAQKGMNIDQMDAVTAYLQGRLKEEIYVMQPEGFEDGTGRVCKLNKAMYGLKQSGRCWNKCLDEALLSFDLRRSAEDPCVYYNTDSSLVVAIYVDDILIFWSDVKVRDELKAKLSETFLMKDLGRARTCVGMTITYGDDMISIDQTKYATEIVHRFGMQDCKPVSSPCDVSHKLAAASGDTNDNVPYREAVGALLYLVQGTRPDLAFAVSNVSRYNDRRDTTHWIAVKRILRYLKGTVDYKISYRRGSGEYISGYVDADWASERDDCRSYSGYVFKLAEGAVSWSCKRQASVAVSSTEAEYIAMTHATKEAIWLLRFMNQFKKQKRIELYCDNQSAMVMASREAYSSRAKHIDVSYHFIREHVCSGLLHLQYVPSANNIADGLTKGVNGIKMKFCVEGFGMYAS